MRLPQELCAEALWVEWDNHYGWISKEKISEILRRCNLKLKKEKTLDDVRLAFGRGLKDSNGIATKQIEQIAEEIDKVCISYETRVSTEVKMSRKEVRNYINCMNANDLLNLCNDINEWRYETGKLRPDCELNRLAEHFQYWELDELAEFILSSAYKKFDNLVRLLIKSAPIRYIK